MHLHDLTTPSHDCMLTYFYDTHFLPEDKLRNALLIILEVSNAPYYIKTRRWLMFLVWLWGRNFKIWGVNLPLCSREARTTRAAAEPTAGRPPATILTRWYHRTVEQDTQSDGIKVKPNWIERHQVRKKVRTTSGSTHSLLWGKTQQRRPQRGRREEEED